MLRLSAWLAIAIGIAVMGAQLARNWGEWDSWPNWLPDIAAGVLLVFGGARALRSGTDRLLIAGWAFAGGLFLSASASHWLSLPLAPEAIAPAVRRVALITSALFAVALVGVGLILFGPRVGQARSN